MTDSDNDPGKIIQRSKPFEEQINIVFAELDLAVHWQRPSILLAICETESVQADVGFALEERLAAIGQQLVKVKVNEKRFDLPQILSRRKDRDHSIYSITGLSCGGGKRGANAYRALNMRREYFVDYHIRAIFWLSKEEMIKLADQAPDFWVFRHRVVEFGDISAVKH